METRTQSEIDVRAHAAPDSAAALDARLTEAYALLDSDAVDVLSLDVFDTLLFRKVPEPVDAFVLIGERLRELGLLGMDVDPRLFSRLRQAAEWNARDARSLDGGSVEVTLGQIYAALPRLAAPDASVDQLSDIEVDIERELLVPDLDMFALVQHARERGKRVIVVSDTYFSEGQVRTFLGRPPAPAAAPDRVFVSSAHGMGKASGLFSVVLRELGVAPDRVLHIGDNPGADLDPPRRLGMRSILFERRPKVVEDLTQREFGQLRGIDSRAHAFTSRDPAAGDHGLAALRSKVLHRAERAALPPELHPYWDYGAITLGPLLTGFAEWVVLRAQGLGMTRVQCLMREGALLAELVNRAAAALGADVHAETLWLSRQVCARAAVGSASRAELEALFVRRKVPTLRELCATLGLDLVTDLPQFADRADARTASDGLGDRVLDAIAEDGALRAKIAARGQETRQRVTRLVESRTQPGSDRVLLVDLGWGGTIQHLLDQVLRMEGSRVQTSGYYLLTQSAAVDRMMVGTALHGFVATGGTPEQPVAAIMRAPEVLEQICMPEHGTQLDLTDALEPVLAPDDNLFLQAAERNAVQAGIFAFQRQWTRYGAAVPWGLRPLAEAKELLLAVLARAVLAPTKEEATAFGAWMHDEGFGSSDVEHIVTADGAAALPYLDPIALSWEVPFQEVYWPFALASLNEDALGRATALLHAGLATPDMFAAELETGYVEFYVDAGWGFSPTGMTRVRARSNRHGRSYARAELRGDHVRRIRFDPAQGPCIVRLDWITLRAWPRDAANPVDHRIAGKDGLGALTVKGANALRPGLLMVSGNDPQIEIDVVALMGVEPWKVEVAAGFAILPLQPSQARQAMTATKARAVRFAKTSPLGRPLRLARRVLRKLGR